MGGGCEVEGSRRKEKGLVDMDNSVTIAELGVTGRVGGGGRGHKGDKWSWKTTRNKPLKTFLFFWLLSSVFQILLNLHV